MKVLKRIFQRRAVSSNINEYALVDQNNFYLKIVSKLRSLQQQDPQVLEKLFSPERGDTLGYKRILCLSEDLFSGNKIPDYIKRVISGEKESFSEVEFSEWLIDFKERLHLFGVQQDGDKLREKESEYLRSFLLLSDLDLIFLKNEFNDSCFNEILFKHLPLTRLKNIFDFSEFEELMTYSRGEVNTRLESHYLALFHHGYTNLLNENQRSHISQRDLNFFYTFMETVDRGIKSGFVKQKTVYEICRIMLELDNEYRIKLFKIISNDIKHEVLKLTQDTKVVFNDDKYLRQLIREIKKEYYSGKFSINSCI